MPQMAQAQTTSPVTGRVCLSAADILIFLSPKCLNRGRHKTSEPWISFQLLLRYGKISRRIEQGIGDEMVCAAQSREKKGGKTNLRLMPVNS
jgi:hypothetical protein